MGANRRWGWVALLGLLVMAGSSLAAGAATTQVILVRHAEKAAEPKGDPVLSELGHKRVKLLGEMLSLTPLTHLYATEFQRTQLTVRPLAEERGLVVIVVPANDSAGLARRLREQGGGFALVAGHSNTLGAILEALGADPVGEIPDNDYDNFFVVTLAGEAKPTAVRLRYRPAEP